MGNTIKVVELFAGVGGFRVGFDKVNQELGIKAFEIIWANQWEPGKINQPAFDCYTSHFGKSENHVNKDIAKCHDLIPQDFDLLVGGFPCQDYSVAATNAKGIEGKKGVLWWDISKIIKSRKPKFILLENVDRLIKSPAKLRGRDFGVILRDLYDSGYNAEWRVINAADYGFSQRRKRVFIFAWQEDLNLLNDFVLDNTQQNFLESFFVEKSFFSSEFKIKRDELKFNSIEIKEQFKSIVDISNTFNFRFENLGNMINGNVNTAKYFPIINDVKRETLENVLLTKTIDSQFFLNEDKKNKMQVLKNSKKIERYKPNGEKYYYSEGKMSLVDASDKASRTMLTSEGTVNRSTHLVKDVNTEKLRFLHPIECERLNGFEDDWTNSGMSMRMRYFCMGNALIVGIIEKLGYALLKVIDEFNKHIKI